MEEEDGSRVGGKWKATAESGSQCTRGRESKGRRGSEGRREEIPGKAGLKQRKARMHRDTQEKETDLNC